ncbi:MAG: DUF5696 domain-containing protein [Acidobacteriota bacterium]
MRLTLALFCSILAAAQVLENRALRLQARGGGAFQLTDKATGVAWDLNPPRVISKAPAEGYQASSGPGRALRFTLQGVAFELRLTDNPPAVEYSFTPRAEVEEVLLLNQSLEIGPGQRNYYALPQRMGVLMPVEGDKPHSRRLRAYETGRGYSMAMFGAVKEGSALMLTWEDPYTEIVVDYAVEPRRKLAASLAMRRTARSVRLRPLGGGGYVEIAKAYREVARQRGYLKTLAEKARENPAVERFFGAADFKPFAFMRRAPNTRWNKSDQWTADLNFTFEECAQLAEHYKNDLGIDRALLVLNGWINGGYDNRHPDILPAAPEIGGDAGLIECARRVKALGGWVFGLHDNYQDFYQDARSWDESYLMKNADGTSRKGGVWAGGLAWLICSKKSLELAARPRNLPAVKKQFAPDLYFSDTVFAAPLYECFDRDHPLTKAGDLRYKQELGAYIRKMFGLYGSEEGREWGVAGSDYFEGLMSHRTRFQNPNDTDIVIPLFELVFGDAIPIYAHQSDRPRPDNPGYILDHVLFAEMPVYYFGRHRYWLDPAQEFKPPAGAEARMVFARGGRFGLIDQFIKNTYEVLSPLHRLTALLPMTDHRFVTQDRRVERTRFGKDVEITVNYGPAEYEEPRFRLPQYGFVIESPALVAFHARRYRGLPYEDPPLFVLRSLDGRPLGSSRQVRIYRGFGDRRVEFKGKTIEVDVEKVL